MGEETALIESALDRYNVGDSSALNDLLAHAGRRLQLIAHCMLQGDRLHGWEQTDDLTQEFALRLLNALKGTKLHTAAEFFRFSSTVMRRALIDLARHIYGPEGSGANREAIGAGVSSVPGVPVPTAGSSNSPDALAAWGKFHESVEQLPDEQREVFNLLWYQDLSQADAANVLNLSISTIKRRWREARLALIDVLGDNFPELS